MCSVVEVMECVCALLGMWIDQEIKAKFEDELCTCLRVLACHWFILNIELDLHRHPSVSCSSDRWWFIGQMNFLPIYLNFRLALS
jgi:hypothetical protein